MKVGYTWQGSKTCQKHVIEAGGVGAADGRQLVPGVAAATVPGQVAVVVVAVVGRIALGQLIVDFMHRAGDSFGHGGPSQYPRYVGALACHVIGIAQATNSGSNCHSYRFC